MDYEDILTPVALYRDRLKEEHRRNTAETFEELFKRSGVDAEANAALVKVIRKLEKLVSSLDTKLKLWKFFRILMIFVAVIGFILVVMSLVKDGGNPTVKKSDVIAVSTFGGVICIMALALIFGVLNGKIKRVRESLDARRADLQQRMDEAWQMMEPLNRLYRWDTVAQIVMKTLPIIAIDRYVSEKRLRQLTNYFKWGEATAQNVSVLACQSGAVNGNPWVVAEELRQNWGKKTYTGSLHISWQEQEYYTDSNGKQRSRWVTRHQTLTASVEKPIPVYKQGKRLIYGNEAAPNLKFSRSPNPVSAAGSGFWGRLKLKNAIAALEKKSRDMSNSFIIMDNTEFDACFNAVDRDNEQQFRLLFTPLAQQEMLNLLRDREQGYGDDFYFYKCGMINTLSSSHLEQLDISGAPAIFKNYELEVARKTFNTYSNEFFRVFFFSFAPLFCVPLYQQHRNFQDIYEGIIEEGDPAFFEHESFANMIGENQFAPGNAITRSILKTSIEAHSGKDAQLTVTAHAFRGEKRTDYISKYGGDGKYHDVPVEWIEYLPVSRKSPLAVCNAETSDHLKFADELRTPEWKNRLASLGANAANLWFRRGLAAFMRGR